MEGRNRAVGTAMAMIEGIPTNPQKQPVGSEMRRLVEMIWTAEYIRSTINKCHGG